MAPYRPPGRSNRSGRTNADNDVFEGLPVKQWSSAPTRISLAPPVSEVQGAQSHDKWNALVMPRDWHSLQPWTQQLLRLARSGKVGQKRKAGEDGDENQSDQHDEDNANDSALSGAAKAGLLGDNRAFVAKKWRHVPEHSLVPEHLHLEFLAKRRKGLPNFYHDLNGDGLSLNVPMRKTKVHKVIDATTGEIAVYDILVPEGQSIEGEVLEGSEYADRETTVLTAGAVIEGLGVANDEGVIVSELRTAAAIAQRRNRPPPKKKGGPGRGKKRVTFTNPDGSTYTTIVPNATKIVPQPGQTVKHVAKGEEAAADVTAEEAATMAKAAVENGEGDDDEEGDDDDDEDEDGEDEGDDLEEGEVTEDGAKPSSTTTPAAETVAADPQQSTATNTETEQTPALTEDATGVDDSQLLDNIEAAVTDVPSVEAPPLESITATAALPTGDGVVSVQSILAEDPPPATETSVLATSTEDVAMQEQDQPEAAAAEPALAGIPAAPEPVDATVQEDAVMPQLEETIEAKEVDAGAAEATAPGDGGDATM